MRVLFAVSEIAPWVKTGGLGDVAAALPAALSRRGVDVRVLAPLYPAMREAFPNATPIAALPALAPGLPPCSILEADADGLAMWLIECPELFGRAGHPYLTPEGRDWPDNGLRFGLLSRIAATLSQPWSPLAWQPDLLHLNDWQTALAAAYLHFEGGAASLLTIHNVAFQGCFDRELMFALRLPESAWRFDGVEYHGHFSFLKAGLQFATRLSTVSPSYAREIAETSLGYGFEALLSFRRAALSGILNGIDRAVWNPATDPALTAPYAANRLGTKRLNKAALQQSLGLATDPTLPLFGVVSRLTAQKGLDWVLILGDRLAELPAQLVVLGTGDPLLEAGFTELAARHPSRVATVIGFDETLAHRIEAGADAFLMPSRFEPCGLNQLYSLAYGTPPIVRATGGLADTVIDCTPSTLADGSGNGFVFQDADPEALWQTILRAAAVWMRRGDWRRLQQNGMRCDHSWKTVADDYLALYRLAISER